MYERRELITDGRWWITIFFLHRLLLNWTDVFDPDGLIVLPGTVMVHLLFSFIEDDLRLSSLRSILLLLLLLLPLLYGRRLRPSPWQFASKTRLHSNRWHRSERWFHSDILERKNSGPEESSFLPGNGRMLLLLFLQLMFRLLLQTGLLAVLQAGKTICVALTTTVHELLTGVRSCIEVPEGSVLWTRASVVLEQTDDDYSASDCDFYTLCFSASAVSIWSKYKY